MRKFILLAAAVFCVHGACGQTTAGAGTAPVVRTIDIEYGSPAVLSREKILGMMHTAVGKPYSERAIRDDTRALSAIGGVVKVRIFGEPVPDGLRVVVAVNFTYGVVARGEGGFGTMAPYENNSPVAGGDSLACFSAEYNFPVIGLVRGPIFYDGSFVYPVASDAASTGVRLDLPIGPVQVDYGVPIRNPHRPSSEPYRNPPCF